MESMDFLWTFNEFPMDSIGLPMNLNGLLLDFIGVPFEFIGFPYAVNFKGIAQEIHRGC